MHMIFRYDYQTGLTQAVNYERQFNLTTGKFQWAITEEGEWLCLE